MFEVYILFCGNESWLRICYNRIIKRFVSLKGLIYKGDYSKMEVELVSL